MGKYSSSPDFLESYENWWEKEITSIAQKNIEIRDIYRNGKNFLPCLFKTNYIYKDQTLEGTFAILKDGTLAVVNLGGYTVDWDGDIQYKTCQYPDLYIPDEVLGKKVTEIGGGDGFLGVVCGLSDIQSLIVPNTIRKINDGAFRYSSDLTIVIPDTVKTIGESIIDSEAYYEQLNIYIQLSPENEYFTIMDNILYDKKNKRLMLKLPSNGSPKANCTLTIPEGIQYVDPYAFQKDSSYCKVFIPSTMKRIPECAFTEMTNVESVNIAEGVEEIGAYAFYDLRKLTDITIPSTVSKIEEYGIVGLDFDWCKELNKENIVPLNCHVVRNSYGANYAIQNGYNRVYADSLDWLK